MTYVPDLGEKLALLAKHSDIGGWAGLEAHFGRKIGTLRYWGHGNDARPRNHLPEDQNENFRRVLAKALGLETAAADVHRFVDGPAAELERALLARDAPSLSSLIDRLGEARPFDVFKVSQDSVQLVQIDRQGKRRAAASIPLGQRFALRFGDLKPWTTVWLLQQSPTAWGYLGCGSVAQNHLVVPPQPSSGITAFMREDNESGIHRFAAIMMRRRPPFDLERFLAEGLPLDLPALGTIANHLQDLRRSTFQIIYADIELIADD